MIGLQFHPNQDHFKMNQNKSYEEEVLWYAVYRVVISMTTK
jgi:hypothetical protein